MSETTTNLEPEHNLTHSSFHRIMVFFYAPGEWSGTQVGLVALLLAAVAAAVWLLLSSDVRLWLYVLSLQLLFFASDYLVLTQQPQRKIAFCNWKGQYFPLVASRLLATALLAPIGLWLGWAANFALLATVQALGLAALYHGALREPRKLGLSRLTIATDRLPPGTRPITILHISDLHIERLSLREEQLLEIADQLEPDIIVITGDYANLSFNRDPVTHEQIRQLLSQLKAPHGVYATLGSPPADLPELVSAVFKDLDVVLLRDEWRQLDLGEGRNLIILGLNCHHDIPIDSRGLARLMSEVTSEVPQVLLYHSPELMPQVAAAGIDLYLCGHTHGGQVRLPLIGPVLTMSALGRRYVMGHYHEGSTHLYVSRGVGFEGLSAPRVRFLCPPEVLLITITPASK